MAYEVIAIDGLYDDDDDGIGFEVDSGGGGSESFVNDGEGWVRPAYEPSDVLEIPEVIITSDPEAVRAIQTANEQGKGRDDTTIKMRAPEPAPVPRYAPAAPIASQNVKPPALQIKSSFGGAVMVGLLVCGAIGGGYWLAKREGWI